MKHTCTIALMILAAAVPCWAQTFSVGILEDSQGREAPEFSDSVLGGCLDYLFEQGLIATNETVGRVEQAAFQTRGYGLASAREGLVDYAAFVWIRYEEQPGDPDVTIPVAVLWRLMRVRDGALLAEGSEEPPAYAEMTLEERKDGFQKFGRFLADIWAKAL